MKAVLGTGELYNVFTRNCQEYATCLFEYLIHFKWYDPAPLNYKWHPQRDDHFKNLNIADSVTPWQMLNINRPSGLIDFVKFLEESQRPRR